MRIFLRVLKYILLTLLVLAAALVARLSWYEHQWKQDLIGESFGKEVLSEEVTLGFYEPFTAKNLLVSVTPKPKLQFNAQNAPSIDGATAAYPLYAGAAQALYTPEAAAQKVHASKTSQAYERLIKGEVDVIFVAQASQVHQKKAAEKNITLKSTPLGKEAFVFLVSQDNPVRSLTAQQVRDIYSGRAKKWNEVGGSDHTIMAFQRPENSGSQTVMLAKVMGQETMRKPLQEERVQGMGSVVKRVADYRNDVQSIGYSFRYYATRMKNQDGVFRLLAIDGVEPSAENIRTGRYPFTVDVYMVTADEPKPATRKLMDWMLSPAGQKLVQDTGYIPLK
jgi:phosphate transport system substrate-binding protein